MTTASQSRFSLQIPAAAALAERARVDVLVIDDDEVIRSLLVEVIKRAGYSLRAAANGKDGLKLLATCHFRLMITDILMPDMDGLELIMQCSGLHPKIPILAMSGGGAFTGAESCLKQAKYFGCERILAKPFEINHFMAALKDVLD